jgi:polar amino acid transport system substrate-binding protein
MKGVAFDLGKELALRLGVPFERWCIRLSEALLDGAKSGAWDVSMFGSNPERSKQFDFTQTVIEIEFGYLAPSGSSLVSLADVDKPGIRVGVQENSAVQAILSRQLKTASLVPGPGVAGGIAMLKSGKADVFASNKSILFEMSDQLTGSRVLPGSYATEAQSIALPKGRDAGMAYLRNFVEEATSGRLAKAAVARAGLRGAVEPCAQMNSPPLRPLLDLSRGATGCGSLHNPCGART